MANRDMSYISIRLLLTEVILIMGLKFAPNHGIRIS